MKQGDATRSPAVEDVRNHVGSGDGILPARAFSLTTGQLALLRLLENALRDPQAELLAAALAYAARGFPVLPLCWPDEDGNCACGRGHNEREVGKAPLLQDGVHGATTDPVTIRDWWAQWPEANVGIALKPASLLLLDLDSHEALEEARKNGLPPGPAVRTGRGEHRYFRNPWSDVATAVRKGASCAVDVKVSGFVVAPPSVHASGHRYEWSVSLDEAPLVPAPDWVRGLLHPAIEPTRIAPPSELPKVDVEALRVTDRIRSLIKSGETGGYPSRSEAGFAVLSALVKAGHSDGEMFAVLKQNPIGDYARDRGNDWIAGEIARARAKVTNQSHPRAPGGSGSVREARRVATKWLHLDDLDVVDVILATVLANTAPGDPVWLLVVGPPSSAKSELLRALGDDPRVFRVSSLTGKTLISGHKDADGGLLFRVKEGSTLLLLDFGQILSLHPNEKALVLQRLREVYDGYSKADFGNSSQGREWKGRLGFLAGTTPAIEKYTSVGAELGDRFLFFRVDIPDRQAQVNEALAHSGQEGAMRAEISAAFEQALNAAGDPSAVTVDEETRRTLGSLADLATRLRTPVSRDRYTHAVDYIPTPEGPARFGKALLRVGKGLAAVRGENEIGPDELRVLGKIALNSIPSRRFAVVRALATLGEATNKEIGLEAELPTASAGYVMEDCLVLGIAERRFESGSDGEIKENATSHWRIRDEILRQWEEAVRVANGEAPQQKQTRDVRDVVTEDGSVRPAAFADEAGDSHMGGQVAKKRKASQPRGDVKTSPNGRQSGKCFLA
jgi:hypothetical protein